MDSGKLISGASYLSWVAGIFEGEGTVTITRSGSRGYTRPAVMLTSTDKQVVDEIAKRWPGQIKQHQPKGNAKLAYCWTLSTRRSIARFLFDILPFIRRDVVREKIYLALDDIGARAQGSGASGYLESCHERREAMRALNKRGVA